MVEAKTNMFMFLADSNVIPKKGQIINGVSVKLLYIVLAVFNIALQPMTNITVIYMVIIMFYLYKHVTRVSGNVETKNQNTLCLFLDCGQLYKSYQYLRTHTMVNL